MLAPLIDVLLDARTLCGDPAGDFTWSSWEDAGDAVAELDRLLRALRATARRPPGLAVLLLPTGPMHELAVASGWDREFSALADRFDAAAVRLDFLAGLCDRLSADGAGLDDAALPPEGAGVEVASFDGRVLRLVLDPPADAAELARAWGAEEAAGVPAGRWDLSYRDGEITIRPAEP